MARILVIEDKRTEIEKAILAGKEAGHEVIAINPTYQRTRTWINAMQEVDGVITDLMFEPINTRNKDIPPAGLMVVIHAIACGKPVVICTNDSEVGGHHGETIGWLFDGYITNFQGDQPFGWEDGKDWKYAFENLNYRLEKAC